MTTQLFATIKKTSKYFYQQPMTAGRAVPFPVSIVHVSGMWPVNGGVGGWYRLTDVSLWARSGDGDYLLVKP